MKAPETAQRGARGERVAILNRYRARPESLRDEERDPLSNLDTFVDRLRPKDLHDQE